MAIDYAAIVAQKKKSIQDYLSNQNTDYSQAQDVLNRPSDEQSYKDILKNYSGSYNLDPRKIDALTQKYARPTLKSGKYKTQQKVDQAKYNSMLGNVQNRFAFPTSELAASNEALMNANERATISAADQRSQEFTAKQDEANRKVTQQKSDIANQYGNTMALMGYQAQDKAYSDQLIQSMLRSIFGLGGVIGTGVALGSFKNQQQPLSYASSSSNQNVGSNYNPYNLYGQDAIGYKG